MDLDMIKSLITGDEDDTPDEQGAQGVRSSLARATWSATARRDPVSWVRHVLAESHELTFRPQGELRWASAERFCGTLVTTTVSIAGDVVEVEASAPAGITDDNVGAVRAYQMLRQGVFKIRGFVRAEPGRPLVARCRHAITGELDLDRLIIATNHNVCSALPGVTDIVCEGELADVWARDRARALRALRKFDLLLDEDER